MAKSRPNRRLAQFAALEVFQKPLFFYLIHT